MLKNRGFTIIELLAVIVIIAVITSIAVPSIFKITDKAKTRLYCSKLEIVQKSAERYADDNSLINTCEVDGIEYPCESITIQELINGNYLDADDTTGSFLDPRDKTAINTMAILVYQKNDRSYAYIADTDCESSITSVLTPSELSNVKHTLTVNATGGTWSGTSPINIREGLTTFINTPTKVGYVFSGWSVTGANSSITSGVFTMGTEDTTITANWTANSYTLTVLANGGIWSGTTPQTIAYGSSVTISDPTRANYNFTGWTVSGTGSSMEGTTFTMGTGNATLTANWVVNTFTLTVNANGGTWSGTTPQTLSPGATTTINNPSRSGYVFTGWGISGSGSISGTTYTMGMGDATITANWLAFANMYTYTGSSTVINDGSGNWRIKFLTSGTFTPAVNMTIDVFLVGGGGGGGTGGSYNSDGGGGGGYTKTYTNKSLTAGTNYSIVIGAGGSTQTNGHSSSGFGYSASGGYGTSSGTGGAGGSGGGSGATSSNTWGKNGGSNGANGTSGSYSGGAGQGTNTYEFGNSSLPAYSGGGGGGAYNNPAHTFYGGAGGVIGGGAGGSSRGTRTGANGTANTGGGGGGGSG
ncbi:MAG TPA: InlB B-repeat-containing protein, partial [Bacilli bacterium]|nr:InlB B-repeat-containing protein [Bacilli bacterium]